MLTTALIVGIVSLLSALIGALIALKIQYGQLRRMQAHNEGWEGAQEKHQHDWEAKQEKYAAEVEARLTQRVQQVQRAWASWQARDQERIQALDRELKDAKTYLHVKHELARLPRIEERPLATQTNRQQNFPNWQPPALQGADLSEQDLSHRYLAQADLRQSNLTNTNLFMADLSGAYLAGANLSGTNLSGANLAGADLRGATLTGANFLVADLHRALLLEADLRGARSLTSQQISTAIYDSTTRFDAELAIPYSHLYDEASPASSSQPEPVVLEDTGKMAAVSPAEVFLSAPASETVSKAAPLPAVPETPSSPTFSDIELLIPQQEEIFASPLPLSDTLLGQGEADLPGDTPENTHTEVFDTTTPNVEYNGNRRAVAN